jgi:hypothetical protein
MAISKKNLKVIAGAALCVLAQTNIEAAQGNRNRWQPDEDAALRAAVEVLGPNHWSQIAASVPGRSDRQCRDRWFHHFAPDFPHDLEHAIPNLKRDPWTPAEDALLRAKQYELGNHWAAISQFLPGRSSIQIKNRWHNYLKN